MGKSVRISKKYGVNPSVTHCECCGKEIGVALFGTSWKDEKGRTAEAPRDVYLGLCSDCQSVVDQDGLIVIEVRDGESGNNPFRTGRLIGITKEAKERLFQDVTSNIVYMEHSMFSDIFDESLKEQEKTD